MNTHFSPSIEEFRRLQKLRPNYSEIARGLGVTPQHVRRVFLGFGTSARVMTAIEKHLRDKARKQQKHRQVAA